MKKPQTPPAFDDLMRELRVERFPHVISKVRPSDYLHWDQLRHRTPPEGLTHREWWLGMKLWRRGSWRDIPLIDCSGTPFRFLITDPMLASLHQIDLGMRGFAGLSDQLVENRNRYAVDLRVEEAITSSQLEGATTTRRVAREMLRDRRTPQNRSEQMILNNYRAMQAIAELKDRALTQSLIFDLHRMVMEDILDAASGSGRFRYADESIYVTDQTTGDVLHRPPPAEELPERLHAMCDFANGKTPDGFIHPALRAIMLHFWLGYDHPFVDGNGRTARALFYWSMLHNGYSLFEFLSISQILRKAPVRYGRSFLYTETDDNDLTYFIFFQLRVIERAVQALREYIERKKATVRRHRSGAEIRRVQSSPTRTFKPRAPPSAPSLYDPGSSEQPRCGVPNRTHGFTSPQRWGLLDAAKVGKRWIFTPVENLSQKLRGS